MEFLSPEFGEIVNRHSFFGIQLSRGGINRSIIVYHCQVDSRFFFFFFIYVHIFPKNKIMRYSKRPIADRRSPSDPVARHNHASLSLGNRYRRARPRTGALSEIPRRVCPPSSERAVLSSRIRSPVRAAP